MAGAGIFNAVMAPSSSAPRIPRRAHRTLRRVATALAVAAAAVTAQGPAAPSTPAAPLAVVPVQVTYRLSALLPALEQAFPVRDSLDRAQCARVLGLLCHQYAYQRTPLQLDAQGARVTLRTQLAYRARVALPVAGLAGCGFAPEPPRRADVVVGLGLYWRRDWRIGTANTQVQANLLDPCRVTALNVDAVPVLRTLVDAQLRDVRQQVDSALPAVADLRPLADSLWRSFSEPIALDTLNTLWLVLNPEAVRVTPFAGDGPSIRTALVLYARPAVIGGTKPVVTVRPLPVLALGEAPTGFVVPVTVELPFEEVDRRFLELLRQETQGTGMIVNGVRVRAAGSDSVRIALDLDGQLRGTMTLAARLGWDQAAQELQLEGLDWSIESRGFMSRLKSTLGAPLIGRALRKATGGGKVPLGAQLDSVRTELFRTLNRPVAPGTTLGANIAALRVEQVLATPRGFQVRARLTGDASVLIEQ